MALDLSRPSVVIEAQAPSEYRALNQLEAEAAVPEAQASDVRWKQAEEVSVLLASGKSTREVAANWISAKSGKPFSHTHVALVARTWSMFVNLGLHERPAWNEAYHSPEVRRSVRRESMEERIGKAVAEAPALSAAGTFQVLYVDPPWRYEHAEPTRAIENNYPTMSLDEIKALVPPASNDSVLFLWATSPKLAEALEVMAAWDFDYRTNMVWVKDKIGMGYYARQRHELLLIGKRGELPVPAETARPDSVIEAPRTVHSAKPDCVYDVIDGMYPGMAKVELFARQQRDGWASWGNQV